LARVVEAPDCHAFLRESFEVGPGESFTIESVHEHSNLAIADGSFEQTLARAAADRLGAYSRDLSDATVSQVGAGRDLFGAPGSYSAFVLTPGTVAGCPVCADYNGHLFTSWFYGVAWAILCRGD